MVYGIMVVRCLYSLVMEVTARVKAGCEPGGAVGVQDTDWASLAIARVPSFFLYAAEPLVGAILLPWTIYTSRRACMAR